MIQGRRRALLQPVFVRDLVWHVQRALDLTCISSVSAKLHISGLYCRLRYIHSTFLSFPVCLRSVETIIRVASSHLRARLCVVNISDLDISEASRVVAGA